MSTNFTTPEYESLENQRFLSYEQTGGQTDTVKQED